MNRGWLSLAGIALVVALSAAAAGIQAFTLTDSKGKVHRLQDYRGKWVLVNFWATWCEPCLEEIPDLVGLYEARAKKDLMVIGIAMEYQSPESVLQFADQMLISYPVVLGDKTTAAQFGRILALPTTYLYAPDGKLAATQVGPVARNAIERLMDERGSINKDNRAPPGANSRQMVRPL